MAKIIKVKNTTGSIGTWVGQQIADGSYYQLQAHEFIQWANVSAVFTDVANGNLVVNDGAKDLTDSVVGWNWLTGEETQIDTATGKHTLHESSRPQISGKNFHTVWTGAGDDMTTPELGAGNLLEIQTTVGQATTTVEAQFHKNYGDVYLHEGYIQWENAGWGDYLDAEIYATATPLQQATNLDYTIDAGVKIRAAAGGAGTGTDGLGGDPVWVPNSAGTGWWDIVGGSAVFSSGQTGAYDWYNIETLVDRFVNCIPVYGSSSNYIMLQSADTTLLPNGYLVRIIAHNVSNTVWKAWVIMTLYREQTV